MIKLIRASKNADEARESLIKRFELTEIQAKAIVEMRLRQLTGLEQDKLRLEYDEIVETIADLKDILSNEPRRYQIIKDELIVIRDKYGDERRSEIEYAGGDMRIEDMIPDAKSCSDNFQRRLLKTNQSRRVQSTKQRRSWTKRSDHKK